MAERGVFLSRERYPFFEEIQVQFEWFGGFARSQKRKCELSLHQNFQKKYPEQKILEISSASTQQLGTQLSAMNLKKKVTTGVTTVESAFQSSRVYRDQGIQIGPFPEYLFLPGRECKKLVKTASKGLHSHQYEFDGMTFYAPEFHISLFYDYLYLNALLEEENSPVREELLQQEYTAFTDLATKSLNSQARSCAIFIGLVKAGLVEQVKDYDSYIQLFRVDRSGKAVGRESYENVQMLYNGKVKPLSPVVLCQVTKAEIESLYQTYFSA